MAENQVLPIRIGIMGSAKGHITKTAERKAYHLGELIAEQGHYLVTGATNGLPLEAAKGAASKNGKVFGISPAKNATDHVYHWHLPLEPHTFITYTGMGFDFRDHFNIFNSEIVIFVGGGIGTLNEFTLAYHENKIIGILEESNGVSRMIHQVIDSLAYRTNARIFFSASPEELLELTIKSRITEGLDESTFYYE
ncbi:MAG: LOG family protein [Candidatus Abawacabacteria bacterium]|nr:LOG family protein [Candidatus Abawacabacteria bacterium]